MMRPSSLAPEKLDQFTGQEEICQRLSILIRAAREREDPLPHILLHGGAGLGKTTLARLFAEEMGTKLVVTSAPALEKAGDLAGILTSLERGDVFFIDEIHRLGKGVEEYLYSAMERFALDIVIDSGPNARTVHLQLQPHTLVGATTRLGMVSAPLRSRFAFSGRLKPYSVEELERILQHSAHLLGIEIEGKATHKLASCARGTPRQGNRLLQWTRDLAQTRQQGFISEGLADEALAMLQIDAQGLDALDMRILQVMIDHYGGGPVGLETLSVALGEESLTLSEVHEPFLIQQGLLQRTTQGRKVTAAAYKYLGRERPLEQRFLL